MNLIFKLLSCKQMNENGAITILRSGYGKNSRSLCRSTQGNCRHNVLNGFKQGSIAGLNYLSELCQRHLF